MNIENIKVGDTIKNYKEMCKLLEDKEKGGNSKKYQIMEWERYFKHHKEGYSFVIDEIYDVPKAKQNGIIYIEYIQNLILDLLVQDKNDGQVFLSKNKLYKELNMTNDNYAFCKERTLKLSKFTGIQEINIEEFYASTGDMLRRNIEAALRSLRSRALVYWTSAITVCVIHSNAETNKFNKIRAIELSKGMNEYGEEVYEYKVDSHATKEFRKATKEEVEIIVTTEKRVMQNMNCYNKQEIVARGLWDEYIKEVNSSIFKDANILFYYDSYEIIYNKENIFIAWEDSKKLRLKELDKVKQKRKLNLGIMERVCENSENRHQKAIMSFSESHDFTDKQEERMNRRSTVEYVDDNESLVDTLIKSRAKDIRNKVRKIRV